MFYVATAPPQQSPEKQEPIPNYNDPKPPENNPETVAGNEEVLSDFVAPTTTPDEVAYSSGPYQQPTHTVANPSDPKVAGVNTTSPLAENDTEEPTDQATIWPVFGGVVFAVAVVMLVSAGIRKIN